MTKGKAHSSGQLSKITYSRRAYLVESGKANWIPLYKYTVEQAIEVAGL